MMDTVTQKFHGAQLLEFLVNQPYSCDHRAKHDVDNLP